MNPRFALSENRHGFGPVRSSILQSGGITRLQNPAETNRYVGGAKACERSALIVSVIFRDVRCHVLQHLTDVLVGDLIENLLGPAHALDEACPAQKP